jgi:hypothetical protein
MMLRDDAAIQDPEVGLAEMACEPVGIHKRRGKTFNSGHVSLPIRLIGVNAFDDYLI